MKYQIPTKLCNFSLMFVLPICTNSTNVWFNWKILILTFLITKLLRFYLNIIKGVVSNRQRNIWLSLPFSVAMTKHHTVNNT